MTATIVLTIAATAAIMAAVFGAAAIVIAFRAKAICSAIIDKHKMRKTSDDDLYRLVSKSISDHQAKVLSAIREPK
jgi:hypothetical protein